MLVLSRFPMPRDCKNYFVFANQPTDAGGKAIWRGFLILPRSIGVPFIIVAFYIVYMAQISRIPWFVRRQETIVVIRFHIGIFFLNQYRLVRYDKISNNGNSFEVEIYGHLVVEKYYKIFVFRISFFTFT